MKSPSVPTFDCRKLGAHAMHFRCPKCHKLNQHGVASSATHRVSHCSCWPDGYFVRLAHQQSSEPMHLGDIIALIVPCIRIDSRTTTN